ncbi:Uncharacterized protein dnm_014320 [Desulfonema magnum]|uniref:Uncharacterized protein n=1 Tax=Desulfonema magnum TaxID=45655 RepID=A0A975GM34_9BACT|nr:Uncharacterized protein dnm_014320 [Desulfonema magnum]
MYLIFFTEINGSETDERMISGRSLIFRTISKNDGGPINDSYKI